MVNENNETESTKHRQMVRFGLRSYLNIMLVLPLTCHPSVDVLFNVLYQAQLIQVGKECPRVNVL